MIAAPDWAEVRYIVEWKFVFRNGFAPGAVAGSTSKYSSADRELSELAGELKR